MPIKPKTFPFIVLIHSPEVIYTGCIKGAADKSLCKSSSYQIGFGLFKISSYHVPTIHHLGLVPRKPILHAYLPRNVHTKVSPHIDMQGICTCCRIDLPQFSNWLCNSFKCLAFWACAWEAKLLYVTFQLRFPEILILRQIKTGKNRQ